MSFSILKEVYSKVKTNSGHRVLVLSTYCAALEIGFKPRTSQTIEATIKDLFGDSKDVRHSYVLIFKHRSCPDIVCQVKYVEFSSQAVIHAFVEDRLVGSIKLSIHEYVHRKADLSNVETVFNNYLEFVRVIKDECLLKMVAEAQYEANVPQTFGINTLPLDCLESVLMSLDLADIPACSSVNKCFYDIIRSKAFWKKYFIHNFGNCLPKRSYSRNWKAAVHVMKIHLDYHKRLEPWKADNCKYGRAA